MHCTKLDLLLFRFFWRDSITFLSWVFEESLLSQFSYLLQDEMVLIQQKRYSVGWFTNAPLKKWASSLRWFDKYYQINALRECIYLRSIWDSFLFWSVNFEASSLHIFCLLSSFYCTYCCHWKYSHTFLVCVFLRENYWHKTILKK